MPWECKACATALADTEVCPTCGSAKTAWTMGVGTRVMVVGGRRKVACARVMAGALAPFPDPTAAWEATDEAPVCLAAEARRRMEAGSAPDVQDVLRVILEPGTARSWDLTLSVLYDGRATASRRLAFERAAETLDDEGRAFAYVLCVSGPGVDGLDFAGLHVLDVTEEDVEAGHAPQLEVSGLRARPVALRLRLRGAAFRVLIVDRLDRPVADAPFLLEADGASREGTTSAAGAVEVEVPAGATEGALTLYPEDARPIAWRVGIGPSATRPVQAKLWARRLGGGDPAAGPVAVRLMIVDARGAPVAGELYHLESGAEHHDGTTTADGVVEGTLAAGATEGLVTLRPDAAATSVAWRVGLAPGAARVIHGTLWVRSRR